MGPDCAVDPSNWARGRARKQRNSLLAVVSDRSGSPLKTIALWTGEMVAGLIEGNFGVVMSISALKKMPHGLVAFLPSQR